MNEKLIIANKEVSNQGKTTSIKKTFDNILEKYPQKIVKLPKGDDINVILNIRGVLVGIESQGDPGSRMPDSLDYFVKSGCIIIVIACHTYGKTYNCIKEVAKENNYDIIWATNDRTDISKEFRDKLNERYAKRVIELIEERIDEILK